MIKSDVDLQARGKHTGHLRLPHSTHESAYGWIPIPVASIRNGDGPTVLVMAGNHGDEYEGQVLVARLFRELRVEDVNGHLILLPMANFPAAQVGRRTSPLDDGNLNRSFPGLADGTVTQQLAHFIENELVRGSELVVDLHSGGSSLLYNGPTVLALQPRNPAESERLRALVSALGFPRAFLHAPNPVTISSAARRQGAISLVTELGGAGMITPSILHAAQQGLMRVLGHTGVLAGPAATAPPPASTRFMHIDNAKHFVYATESGLFLPLVELGDAVVSGQPVAEIHFPDSPLREPETVRTAGTGEIVCKRVPAMTRRGDCLFQLAEDYV
jgi:predicted deacylase